MRISFLKRYKAIWKRRKKGGGGEGGEGVTQWCHDGSSTENVQGSVVGEGVGVRYLYLKGQHVPHLTQLTH